MKTKADAATFFDMFVADEVVNELTPEQRAIRDAYCRLKRCVVCSDDDSEEDADCTGWWPMLRVDQQSFFIGNFAQETRREAVWPVPEPAK